MFHGPPELRIDRSGPIRAPQAARPAKSASTPSDGVCPCLVFSFQLLSHRCQRGVGGLTPALGQFPQTLVIEFHREAFVWRHTPLVGFGSFLASMYVFAVGSIIASHRQSKRTAAVLEGQNVLHGPFAVAPRSHDRRAIVVLQAGGDDLAGTGRVAVDQHGDRFARVDQRSGIGIETVFDLATAGPGRNDPTCIQKHVADVDRGMQESARRCHEDPGPVLQSRCPAPSEPSPARRLSCRQNP